MSESNKEWRTIIIGLPTIRKLLNGEDVEIGTSRVNLIPDDVLHNNRTDVAVLFGDDVSTMERIFRGRALMGGEKDKRTVLVERKP